MHDIFGDRFVTFKAPAWHALGIVATEEMSATEAFEASGQYKVELSALQAADWPGLAIPHRAIVRHPTPDDPEPQLFGIVTADYTLVTPWEFTRLWDERVARPIETFGSLKDGKVVFITTKLPTISIQGDEIENYLIARSPMTGNEAAELLVAQQRVVCQNTMRVAAGIATETYRLVHDATVKIRLGEWMQTIYESAEAKVELVREALEVMAAHRPHRMQVDKVLRYAYMERPEPKQTAPEVIMATRQQKWEARHDALEQRRQAVKDLYAGAGTGMDTPSAKGTTLGLYHCIAEVENYRRGRGLQSITEDTLFGRRAGTMERGFTACLELARR